MNGVVHAQLHCFASSERELVDVRDKPNGIFYRDNRFPQFSWCSCKLERFFCVHERDKHQNVIKKEMKGAHVVTKQCLTNFASANRKDSAMASVSAALLSQAGDKPAWIGMPRSPLLPLTEQPIPTAVVNSQPADLGSL